MPITIKKLSFFNECIYIKFFKLKLSAVVRSYNSNFNIKLILSTNYGFGFGLAITDSSGSPYLVDPSYFTLSFFQRTFVKSGNLYVPQYTSLGYKLCDSTDFPNLSQAYIQRGLNSALYCPQTKNYKIAGNYLSNNFQYVSASIVKCIGAGCKSSDEIDTLLKSIRVSVSIITNYMDFNDYSTPIKSLFDDTNVFNIIPDYLKEIKIYLKLSEANLDDDYLKIKSATSQQFFEVQKTLENLQTFTGYSVTALTKIIFKLHKI